MSKWSQKPIDQILATQPGLADYLNQKREKKEMSPNERVAKRLDDAADALRRMKIFADRLHKLGEEMREIMGDMNLALEDIRPIDEQGVEKLNTRLDRMIDRHRAQEFGSFTIEVGRAMESAWRKLP